MDLGNRRLLDRTSHASVDGANIADIDRVFDSDLGPSPLPRAVQPGIRFNPNGNEILIPRSMIDKFRFKQLDEKGKSRMLTHLDNVKRKLQQSKDLSVQVAKELIEADVDV